jgi:hypothetical protein
VNFIASSYSARNSLPSMRRLWCGFGTESYSIGFALWVGE